MIDASNEPDLLIILTTCKISKICQFESKIIPYKLDELSNSHLTEIIVLVQSFKL